MQLSLPPSLWTTNQTPDDAYLLLTDIIPENIGGFKPWHEWSRGNVDVDAASSLYRPPISVVANISKAQSLRGRSLELDGTNSPFPSIDTNPKSIWNPSRSITTASEDRRRTSPYCSPLFSSFNSEIATGRHPGLAIDNPIGRSISPEGTVQSDISSLGHSNEAPVNIRSFKPEVSTITDESSERQGRTMRVDRNLNLRQETDYTWRDIRRAMNGNRHSGG